MIPHREHSCFCNEETTSHRYVVPGLSLNHLVIQRGADTTSHYSKIACVCQHIHSITMFVFFCLFQTNSFGSFRLNLRRTKEIVQVIDANNYSERMSCPLMDRPQNVMACDLVFKHKAQHKGSCLADESYFRNLSLIVSVKIINAKVVRMLVVEPKHHSDAQHYNNHRVHISPSKERWLSHPQEP